MADGFPREKAMDFTDQYKKNLHFRRYYNFLKFSVSKAEKKTNNRASKFSETLKKYEKLEYYVHKYVTITGEKISMEYTWRWNSYHTVAANYWHKMKYNFYEILAADFFISLHNYHTRIFARTNICGCG